MFLEELSDTESPLVTGTRGLKPQLSLGTSGAVLTTICRVLPLKHDDVHEGADIRC